MGWWLQAIGGMMAIISAVLLFIGFIISPQENIFRSIKNVWLQIHFGSGDNVAGNKITQERKLFSDTQYIRFLPTQLGGIDRISLDNIGTMKRYLILSENSLSMILNVSPVEKLSPVKGVEDTQIYSYGKSQIYLFDTGKNRSHQINTSGRKFVVTLNKIKEFVAKNGIPAKEYEFGISEIE